MGEDLNRRSLPSPHSRSSAPRSPTLRPQIPIFQGWREPHTSHNYPSDHHHPHMTYRPSRPPSSSSSSESGSQYDSHMWRTARQGPTLLGPPSLAPYATDDRRQVAPVSGQVQWPSTEGRRSASQNIRSDYSFTQHAPPDHVLAHDPEQSQQSPPLRLRAYVRQESRASSSGLSRPTSSSTAQTPTSMQFSMLTTSDPTISAMSPSLRDGYLEEGVDPHRPRQDGTRSSLGRDLTKRKAAEVRRTPRSRSRSHSSTRSPSSDHSQQSYPSPLSQSEGMVRGLSGSSSGSSHAGSIRSVDVSASKNRGRPSGAAPGNEKKKRTRALMTQAQQSGLINLWKKTKFPTAGDRDILGQEIGLTARQVQVWFQNQRQKGRKTLLVNGGVPDGEDPADYEDLQKSPRSRRLSMEREEQVSAWAGSSASSSAAWPSDPYGDGRDRGPPAACLDDSRFPDHVAPYGMLDGRARYSPSPPYEQWSRNKTPSHHEFPATHIHPGVTDSHTHVRASHDPLDIPQPHGFVRHQPRPLPLSALLRDQGQHLPPASEQRLASSASYSGPQYHPGMLGEAGAGWGGMPYSDYARPFPSSDPRYPSSANAYGATVDMTRRRSVSAEYYGVTAPPLLPPSLPSAPLVPTVAAIAGQSGRALSQAEMTPYPSSRHFQSGVDPRASAPSARSRSSTPSISSGGPVSHLPPTLARIAIPGPVAGGDDLPSIGRGLITGDMKEEVGSPKKRTGVWGPEGRRVRGRGEEEDENKMGATSLRRIVD